MEMRRRKLKRKQKCELLSELGMTYTIGRLRLTRVVFIKSNRTRVTCGLLRPTLRARKVRALGRPSLFTFECISTRIKAFILRLPASFKMKERGKQSFRSLHLSSWKTFVATFECILSRFKTFLLIAFFSFLAASLTAFFASTLFFPTPAAASSVKLPECPPTPAGSSLTCPTPAH